MSCTKTIQDSVTWAFTILKQAPLQVNNMEPGLTFANIVLERILGPPMRWRFNRGTLSFAITPGGGTDYTQSVPNMGWIETQWLLDSSGNIHSLEGALALPKTTVPMRPKTLAPVYDDNAGNITFRVNSVPTANDTVYVDFQQKAPLITSYGSTWAPIPDEYGYIYNKLFLAAAGNLIGDARAPLWGQEGVSALLGAQKGLQTQEIAIFLGEFDRAMKTLAASQDMGKAGTQALTR
jgi:hypothetical protein